MRHLAGFKEGLSLSLPFLTMPVCPTTLLSICLPVSRAVGGLLVTLVREYRPPVAALLRASLRRRRLRLRLRALGLGSGCSARAGMGRGRGWLHFGAMSTSCGKKRKPYNITSSTLVTSHVLTSVFSQLGTEDVRLAGSHAFYGTHEWMYVHVMACVRT